MNSNIDNLVNSLKNLRRAILIEILEIPIFIVAIIIIILSMFFQLVIKGAGADILISSLMNMTIVIGGLFAIILTLYYIYMNKGWKGMCNERTEYCTVRTVFTYLMPICIIFSVLALVFISMGISQLVKEFIPWPPKGLSTEDILRNAIKITPLLTGIILSFVGIILGIVVEIFVFIGLYRIGNFYGVEILKVGAIMKLIASFMSKGLGYITIMQYAGIGVLILYIIALILIYLGIGNAMKKVIEIGAAGGI